MTLAVGDLLPDTWLVDADSRRIQLSVALAGSPALVVFLRHLGCLPCREHLLEALDARGRLGLRIACVSFAGPDLLAGYRSQLGREVLLLGDVERILYRALGFGHASTARVWLDPRVWRRYAELMRRGRRLTRVRQDTLQLGGDIVLAPDGRIGWLYRSRGPEDRPTIAEIANVAATLAS